MPTTKIVMQNGDLMELTDKLIQQEHLHCNIDSSMLSPIRTEQYAAMNFGRFKIKEARPTLRP